MAGTHDLAKSKNVGPAVFLTDWFKIYAWGPVTEVTTETPVWPLTLWPKGLSDMLQASLPAWSLFLTNISGQQTLRQAEIH